MGRIIDIGIDVAYKHEGYVGHLLTDGTTTSSYNSDTRPRITGKLQAACECGWTDTEVWDTDSDRPSGWPSEELEDQILAPWEAHVWGLIDKERDRDRDTLIRRLRSFDRYAKQLESGEADPDILHRLRDSLNYTNELLNRLAPRDDE